ncbi:tetratricopeptide repeat protein [Bacillus sp. DTU_2020_1000418_1_SI_GHA_SEK_038]|uniref:tetratricopeptide repeat protein n=1 Tax=Bacillus sp. DTU_2020_1000418_1_SI_GHA_SEK_038 TaxID=3077585 RepID=UPI0028E1E528|nr:tetratricopeptide repeat protein [Bacillus sp. DTU_2020_1000418_1_SI_GHA_SEK_038]WNS76071.1 tetratricopeptide repeat protein [Bacillus sp. DTU_2020_1000418_1_SI_GHA_SEK_038]
MGESNITAVLEVEERNTGRPKRTRKGIATLLKDKEDKYTGRQNELDLFNNALESKRWDEYKILSYYGVGGIGKTELRKKIMKKLESRSEVEFTFIDFETGELQQVEKALIHLRTEIGKKYPVAFTLFDAAYIIYMGKTNNAINLNEKTLPFVEKGTWVADFVNIIAENPYVSIATKLINVISKRIVHALPKEDMDLIRNFESLEVRELQELLPQIFAEDLERYLLKTNNKFVIFIDTYEALWTDKRMKAYDGAVDEWIRDLVLELPNVFWVVFGREPIDWGLYEETEDIDISYVPLDALSEAETKELLEKHEILDIAIQDEIYRNSEGHPYSIKLSIDTYNNIPNPVVSDFIGLRTPVKLFNRFIKYLLEPEKQALELLALTQGWDIDTYEHLMDSFRILLNEDDHHKLTRFSFITQLDGNTWDMHRLMRDSLIDYQRYEKMVKGRSFLFNYYKKGLSKELVRKETHYAGKLINQAFYQGFMLMEQGEISKAYFIDWFREYDIVFLNSKANYLTLPLLHQLRTFLENGASREDEKYLGVILYDIAFVYMDENRDYKRAERLFKEVLELREQKFSDDKIMLAKSYFGLATLYQRMGRNQEAEVLHEKAFSLRKQYCDSSNIIGLAYSANGLAMLYQNRKDYEKALEYYGIALSIYENLDKSHYGKISTSMMNLISCYHEFHQYDKAYEFSIKVMDIVKNDEHFNQIRYAEVLNVFAVTKTALGQYEEALELLQESYDIFKDRLGEESIYVSKVLHNSAITFKLLQNDTESINTMNKCLEIKNKMVSIGTLKEENINYSYSQEMQRFLQQDTIEYDQLKFNF